jgi:hypothetical protein
LRLALRLALSASLANRITPIFSKISEPDTCRSHTDTSALQPKSFFALRRVRGKFFARSFSLLFFDPFALHITGTQETAGNEMPAAINHIDTELTDADRRAGYRFGCDGLLDFEAASKLLGGASISTIERRIADGKIRAGREGRRVVICRRSLTEYIAGLEA